MKAIISALFTDPFFGISTALFISSIILSVWEISTNKAIIKQYKNQVKNETRK